MLIIKTLKICQFPARFPILPQGPLCFHPAAFYSESKKIEVPVLMKIGFLELIVVFVVALLAIGPDKLPSYARKLGVALREFRKATADVTKDVRENVIEPLEEAQRPIREAIEPLTELDREVRQDIRSIEKDIKNIGKPGAAGHKKEQKPSALDPAAEPEEKQEPPAEEALPDSDAVSEQQTDEKTEGENI